MELNSLAYIVSGKGLFPYGTKSSPKLFQSLGCYGTHAKLLLQQMNKISICKRSLKMQFWIYRHISQGSQI